MSYWAIWLVIVLLLAIMEAATVNLVSVWFIASGIVSLFVSLLCESFLVQFGVFVILGIILLVLTRPMFLKMIENTEHKMNLDRIIGMEGIVTMPIKKNIVGEVKVDGKLWSAIADSSIKEGSIVIVKAIESVKLVVEKVVEEEKEAPRKKTTTAKKSTSKTSAKKKTTTTEKSTSKTATKKKTTANKKTTQKKKESEK